MSRFERLSPTYKIIAIGAVLVCITGLLGIIMSHAFNDSCTIDGILKYVGMIEAGALVLAILLLTTARTTKEHSEYRNDVVKIVVFLLVLIGIAYANKKFLQKPLAGFYSI